MSARHSAGAAPYGGRKLWLVPLLIVSLMLGVGAYLNGLFERMFQNSVQANLQSILAAETAAIRLWLDSRGDCVEIAAADSQVRAAIVDLASVAEKPGSTPEQLTSAPAQKALQQELQPIVELRFQGFLVVDRDKRVLAADRGSQALIGARLKGQEAALVELGFKDANGKADTVVTHPFAGTIIKPVDRSSANLTMLAMTPVLGGGPEKTPVAILALRIDPAREFDALLRAGRPGSTGETYAYDASGVLLSPTREMGPLAALAAAEGRVEAGFDVTGYRDHRGANVVGAWDWVHGYDFGIATEMDYTEAYRPLTMVRGIFWGAFALMSLAAASIVPIGWVLDRRDLRAQRAVLEARRLGQYTLHEKIGEGGMGAVYKAHHAMLRRPTAVKLLDPERTNDATIARFEREVRLTSQLNHPNTIAIFDFGRTPEGVFYYAMEYLDGVDLERLVSKHGPQCEGRTVFILKQICASLREAHAIGLIHRDIKPANIMLNKRGGQFDVAKVLDFGLVKAAGSQNNSGVTLAGAILGTANYVSPEAVTDPDLVDSRSDVYAVGAVGYFLLTGTTVFQGDNSMGILVAHVNKPAEPPSKRLGRPVSTELERIILACLEKSPAKRPQSAAELLDELADCAVDSIWTVEDAAAWWEANPVRYGGSSTMPRTDEIHVAETIIELQKGP
ncbi:MAG: serine/threonine protein kinase [Pirellulales bacterium]|nr:serine/threonine protein kinase [Pirellulales bacterium]